MYKIELLRDGVIQKSWKYESKEMFLRWARKHKKGYVDKLNNSPHNRGHTWELGFYTWERGCWRPLSDIPELRGL